MVFKTVDMVEVVNELETWLDIHKDRQTRFIVRDVEDNTFTCCAGHQQHLTMEDGTQASGFWFDAELVGKPRKWCHGDHYED